MNDDLIHIWCSHCHESLCGLTDGGGFKFEAEELGSGDEGLDCVVCADLQWSSRRKARCLRVTV